MKQLTKMLATTLKAVITITLSLFISISSVYASPNTAVTANLVKYQADENLLICQYQTISASHFQVFDTVLDNESTCPTNIQVAPQPMLTKAEEAQLKQMLSRQSNQKLSQSNLKSPEYFGALLDYCKLEFSFNPNHAVVRRNVFTITIFTDTFIVK